ncbi:predicted protein [Arabidopsis lyrata subsp. lyrata]|uniref:Predicted protein n=1 Tax=Arabidopsis lyrata subsp. lyrata TaxID=81972 RepID=D7L2Q9_ARALL|nr:predicted protein [Arabidopsis lyrata subsp. lyrata]
MDAETSKDSEIGEDQNDLVMEDEPEMHDEDPISGSHFSENTDDLLEDGECQDDEEAVVQVTVEESQEDEGTGTSEEIKSGLKDGGNKQKTVSKNKTKEGIKAGGANRTMKKGIVDLPKPPAQT